MYWTPSQTIIYNDYVKKGVETKLCIDATGTVCKKILRPDERYSGNLYLYMGTVHLESSSGQIPVTQMISESHNISQITFWLSEWMKSVKAPSAVICDHSLALLGATAKAVAEESNLSTYIEKCFNAITRNSPENLKTYIRVDYAHLMKFVSQWNCFRNKPDSIKSSMCDL